MEIVFYAGKLRNLRISRMCQAWPLVFCEVPLIKTQRRDRENQQRVFVGHLRARGRFDNDWLCGQFQLRKLLYGKLNRQQDNTPDMRAVADWRVVRCPL